MAKRQPKISLSLSRDIPFDCLELSQSNVRKIKAGVSIGDLANDIARRTLLQGLNVRAIHDEAGAETGRFEIPAGGRRYRALELLVKQKRLAKDALIPCIVQAAGSKIAAEEDSYAENNFREQLHPLDQFRAMKSLVDKGQDAESIAAHFMTTPAVVRQRLKLASVSPKLHDIYAEDGMTLDQLMAFCVSDDHARQEQVWEMLEHSYNRDAGFIRQKLTENTVKPHDKRVLFVGLDAYCAAGGGVARDLFEDDNGGWLTDPPLLDAMVAEKLAAETTRIGAEGWKWVTTAISLPWDATDNLREIAGTPVPLTEEEEVELAELQAEGGSIEAEWADAPAVPEAIDARLAVIDSRIGELVDRPVSFDPHDIAIAGVFITIEANGGLSVERGFVRPEDEPVAEDEEANDNDVDADGEAGSKPSDPPAGTDGEGSAVADSDDDEDGEGIKPLRDSLIADLTAWRTLALQDAFAQRPGIAFVAVLHAMVLDCFYFASKESCIQLRVEAVSFGSTPEGLRDSRPAQALAERSQHWKERLPDNDVDLWNMLLEMEDHDRFDLLAHCASRGLNAHREVLPKYNNGRTSAHTVERRIEHSNVLARAVDLDLIGAGWRATADGYFRSVTKPQILADVTEARGPEFAGMIDHLKKGDMAREAEKFLEETTWLPEALRTPGVEPVKGAEPEYAEAAE